MVVSLNPTHLQIVKVSFLNKFIIYIIVMDQETRRSKRDHTNHS